MRHRAALLSAIAVLAATAPASADTSAQITTSGKLAATWHGDTAHGCAEAGVCDVTGSVSLSSGDDELSAGSTGSDPFGLLSIDLDRSVVRVLRGTAGTCLDATGPARLALNVTRRSTGRARVALQSLGFGPGSGFSAGRCAGPLSNELARALPTATISARALRGRDVKLDFGGRRTFTAGPFSGTMTSTLRLRAHVSRTRGSSGESVDEPVGAHARRVDQLELTYRATPVGGALVTDFRGAASPACEMLDTCGLVGTHELTVRDPMSVRVFATVPARGRRPSLSSMLAAVRSGRARADAFSPTPRPSGRASVEITRDGAPACRDTRDVALPELLPRIRAGHLTVALGASHFSEPEDPLRTHCPGPARNAERDGALAAGSVPVAQLGAPRLTVTLAPRPVDDPDFTVTPRGSLTLELVRTRAEVRG